MIALTALGLAAAARLRLDLAAPLWLDESWTGAFASEPTLAGLTEQVRNDANAPAYYGLIWAWVQFFGLSDASLHIPSMAVSLLTPALAWAGFRRRRPVLALTWAVLLATWIPGIDQANEARCYPLLFCAAVGSTVAHVRLLEAPSPGRAVAWAGCASFMTLVHYYAGLLALAQGMAFLAMHRGRAFRLWPAALPFAPAFAWIGWHAPRLAAFAEPGVAWYTELPVADLPLSLVVLAGGRSTLIAFVAALSVGATMSRRTGDVERRSLEGRSDAALWWCGGAALAAVAICLGIAVLRPTFTYRYITPFVPGTSLLAAAWVCRIGGASRHAPCALVAGGLAAMALTLAEAPAQTQRLYGFEGASAWLAEAERPTGSGPSRLVFFWDHPSTPAMARGQLDAIGGFFMRRAGLRLAVTPLYPTSDDMNGPAVVAAGPDAAVLWLYDTLVHHTSARAHPPRLAALDVGLLCRDFGGFNIGIVACRRRP